MKKKIEGSLSVVELEIKVTIAIGTVDDQNTENRHTSFVDFICSNFVVSSFVCLFVCLFLQ